MGGCEVGRLGYTVWDVAWGDFELLREYSITVLLVHKLYNVLSGEARECRATRKVT